MEAGKVMEVADGVTGCGQSLEESKQSLDEAGKAYGEKARLQGSSTKLTRVQGKLGAFPSRLLSIASLLHLAWVLVGLTFTQALT